MTPAPNAPDAALLWAREQFKRGCSERMRQETDGGVWDEAKAITEPAEAFRAGQSHADAGLLAALEWFKRLADMTDHYEAGASVSVNVDRCREARAAIAAAKGA